MKLPDSLPVMIWSQDTHRVNAAMIAPVASVPMNESTLIRTTTWLLNNAIARPAHRVSAMAPAGGSPRVFIDQPTNTPANPIVDPMERSNTPAANGITTLSAASPVMAYSFSVVLAVGAVGNRSGFQMAKITISAIHTYTAPMFRKFRSETSRVTRRLTGVSVASAVVVMLASSPLIKQTLAT